MVASASRLLSSALFRFPAWVSKLVPLHAANVNALKFVTHRSLGLSACLQHAHRPKRFGVYSIRRSILGVKQHNSRSVQQVAAHILRVVLPYVRLCAEKQKPRRRGACGHRVTAFCIVSRWLGHKYTTPGIFLIIHPNSEKVSAARCRIGRFAAASGAQSFGCAKCSSPPPPPLRLLSAHIECDDITPCSVLGEGRASAAGASLAWL
jgi:hypothetical protein